MNLIPKLPGIELAWSAIPLALLVYGLLIFDARRKDSAAAADDQLGIKTVAATLVLVSTLLLAVGIRDFLHVLLTFDDFWDRLKGSLPSVLVGGLGLVGTALVLFPKTNASEFPKAKRLAAGIVALVSGVALLPVLAGLIAVFLDWPSWPEVARSLATTVDALAIFGVSFMVLGKLSGIEMTTPKPAAPAGPPPGQPMQQQGYPGQPVQGQPVQGQPQPGYPAQGQPQPGYPAQGQPQQQGYPGQVPPAGPGGWPQG